MMGLQIDDRLFQRGATWQECRESWEFNRENLLERSRHGHLLPHTLERLLRLPPRTRAVVLFHGRTLDSLKAMPFIGNTLARASRLQVRYFNLSWFFPRFYPHLGRTAPRLLFPDQNQGATAWGPRPAQITSEMSEIALEDRDQWLMDYNEAGFGALLDQELADFLEDRFSLRDSA